MLHLCVIYFFIDMWAKKGRKRKKYAINFDFLDVINFIFTLHFHICMWITIVEQLRECFMHPYQSINNHSPNVNISCIALLYATTNACIYFFQVCLYIMKNVFWWKAKCKQMSLSCSTTEDYWPRYARPHARPLWQCKQNNDICYMAEQELVLFNIPISWQRWV